MRFIKIILSIVCFVGICFCETALASPNLKIFSDYNTDILLIHNEPNQFTIIGYGGSTRESADCVFKAQGVIRNSNLSGYLKTINTDIVSYEIEDSLQYQFSANIIDDSLNVLKANLFGTCGLNTIFAREYLLVTSMKDQQKKINDFVELLNGNRGNDEIIFILKSYKPQSSNENMLTSALNEVHQKSLTLFKNGCKSEAAIAVITFLKSNAVTYVLINQENVDKYNDIGFFLEQGKKYQDAVTVLEQVVKAIPSRTVVYINLGDACFGLKNTVKAKEAYNTYIALMKKEGKDNKIPQRVLDRVK